LISLSEYRDSEVLRMTAQKLELRTKEKDLKACIRKFLENIMKINRLLNTKIVDDLFELNTGEIVYGAGKLSTMTLIFLQNCILNFNSNFQYPNSL
jgi:hypothetical protein